MSRTYLAKKNKQQKHQILNFHQYLYNAHEPQMDDYRGSLADYRDEEFENNYFMKRRIRNMAQDMRNR